MPLDAQCYREYLYSHPEDPAAVCLLGGVWLPPVYHSGHTIDYVVTRSAKVGGSFLESRVTCDLGAAAALASEGFAGFVFLLDQAENKSNEPVLNFFPVEQQMMSLPKLCKTAATLQE